MDSTGVQRELVSYDRALLEGLRPGQIVTTGIYAGNGDSEIWSIRAEDDFRRTYEDTVAIRANRLQKNRRFLIGIAFFAACMVVFGRKLGLSRGDA